jgi:hypothetical protein
METFETKLPAKRKLLGMTTSGFDPSSRFRFIQFIPWLQEAGWDVDHRPNRPDRQWSSPLGGRVPRAVHHRAGKLAMKINRLRDIREASRFDLCFMNSNLAGDGLFFEKRLFQANSRVVFDFDDALFAGKNEAAVRWVCQNAAWITPGNEYLADYARRFSHRVTVIPTVIDTDAYAVRNWQQVDRSRMVRVGWSGSDQSIRHSLFPYLPLIEQLQRKLQFEFVIVTNTRPELPTGSLHWSFTPWTVAGEAALESTFDIGLMPLVDNAFQRGKCGLKLLQYMASGLPVVGSPVGVNRDIIQDGRTGFAATSEQEWGQALETLISSFELRASMGSAGRERCVDHYSIRRWLPKMLRVFDRVCRKSLADGVPDAYCKPAWN